MDSSIPALQAFRPGLEGLHYGQHLPYSTNSIDIYGNDLSGYIPGVLPMHSSYGHQLAATPSRPYGRGLVALDQRHGVVALMQGPYTAATAPVPTVPNMRAANFFQYTQPARLLEGFEQYSAGTAGYYVPAGPYMYPSVNLEIPVAFMPEVPYTSAPLFQPYARPPTPSTPTRPPPSTSPRYRSRVRGRSTRRGHRNGNGSQEPSAQPGRPSPRAHGALAPVPEVDAGMQAQNEDKKNPGAPEATGHKPLASADVQADNGGANGSKDTATAN